MSQHQLLQFTHLTFDRLSQYICITIILLIVMGCTYSKRQQQNKYPYTNKKSSKKKVLEYNEEDVLDMNEARAPEGIKQCPMPQFTPTLEVFEGRAKIGKSYKSKVALQNSSRMVISQKRRQQEMIKIQTF